MVVWAPNDPSWAWCGPHPEKNHSSALRQIIIFHQYAVLYSTDNEVCRIICLDIVPMGHCWMTMLLGPANELLIKPQDVPRPDVRVWFWYTEGWYENSACANWELHARESLQSSSSGFFFEDPPLWRSRHQAAWHMDALMVLQWWEKMTGTIFQEVSAM